MTGPGGGVPFPGDGVYRIHWVPGTDLLLGVCFCGADREFEDPVALWDWLLAHPGTGGTGQHGAGHGVPVRPREAAAALPPSRAGAEPGSSL